MAETRRVLVGFGCSRQCASTRAGRGGARTKTACCWAPACTTAVWSKLAVSESWLQFEMRRAWGDMAIVELDGVVKRAGASQTEPGTFASQAVSAAQAQGAKPKNLLPPGRIRFSSSLRAVTEARRRPCVIASACLSCTRRRSMYRGFAQKQTIGINIG